MNQRAPPPGESAFFLRSSFPFASFPSISVHWALRSSSFWIVFPPFSRFSSYMILPGTRILRRRLFFFPADPSVVITSISLPPFFLDDSFLPLVSLGYALLRRSPVSSVPGPSFRGTYSFKQSSSPHLEVFFFLSRAAFSKSDRAIFFFFSLPFFCERPPCMLLFHYLSSFLLLKPFHLFIEAPLLSFPSPELPFPPIAYNPTTPFFFFSLALIPPSDSLFPAGCTLHMLLFPPFFLLFFSKVLRDPRLSLSALIIYAEPWTMCAFVFLLRCPPPFRAVTSSHVPKRIASPPFFFLF